jgi:hypothetical protein
MFRVLESGTVYKKSISLNPLGRSLLVLISFCALYPSAIKKKIVTLFSINQLWQLLYKYLHFASNILILPPISQIFLGRTHGPPPPPRLACWKEALSIASALYTIRPILKS